MMKSAYGVSSLQRDALLNRQFFITSDSRMGLGLDDVREGDLIALFLGA
jgi:hypothetical protein